MKKHTILSILMIGAFLFTGCADAMNKETPESDFPSSSSEVDSTESTERLPESNLLHTESNKESAESSAESSRPQAESNEESIENTQDVEHSTITTVSSVPDDSNSIVITGIVVDADTEEPLENITVFHCTEYGTWKTGEDVAVTGKDGSFSFVLDISEWSDCFINFRGESYYTPRWPCFANAAEPSIGIAKIHSLSNTPWQDLYFDYWQDRSQFDESLLDAEYALIYVNDDDIPELYIQYPTFADGMELLTIYQSEIVSLPMSLYGFSYIERQGLIHNSYGHMDVYGDDIYLLKDGKFILQNSGRYGALNNAKVEYDENKNPIYEYYWSNVLLSEEEYEKELLKVYDESKATSLEGCLFDESALWLELGAI